MAQLDERTAPARTRCADCRDVAVYERVRASSSRVRREVALTTGTTIALSVLVLALGGVLAGIVAFSGSWPAVAVAVDAEATLATTRVERDPTDAAGVTTARSAVSVALRRRAAHPSRRIVVKSERVTSRRRAARRRRRSRPRASAPVLAQSQAAPAGVPTPSSTQALATTTPRRHRTAGRSLDRRRPDRTQPRRSPAAAPRKANPQRHAAASLPPAPPGHRHEDARRRKPPSKPITPAAPTPAPPTAAAPGQADQHGHPGRGR